MATFHVGPGVVAPMGGPQPHVVRQRLGNPQWYNYHWTHLGDPNYNPMVKYLETIGHDGKKYVMVDPGNKDLESALRRSGHQPWLYLNEPDIHDQSPCTPSAAARGVATIRRMKGSHWRYMAPNIAYGHMYGNGWLNRFAYLLDLWGQPKPEAWSIHLHGLPHDRPHGYYIWNAFNDWWKEFLGWMRRTGNERPVIISELSGGRYWPAVHEALLMHATECAINNGGGWELFQGFFWFSTYHGDPRWNSDLMTQDGRLTSIGRTYKGLGF